MKVAFYVRVSSTVQETQRQITLLKKEAKRNKDTVVGIYQDKISGFKDEKNRPDLNRLLQLTSREIQSIYITELTRLSRNPTYLKVLVDEFSRKGINIRCLKPDINSLDSEGRPHHVNNIVIGIFSEYGSYEIELKNSRSASGKREAIISKGNSYSYKPPYGYTNVDKKLILDLNEAKIVKEIFTKYSKGESIRDIVKCLNSTEIPTRNTSFIKKQTFQVNKNKTIDKSEIKWCKSTVRNILRNTVYCGYKEIKGGESIKTDKIVSEELFLKCQAEIKLRITNTDKSIKNDFMLRGFLICGECGKQYLGTRSHTNLLYKCSDKTHRLKNSFLDCKNTSIFKVHVEEMVWSSVKGAYVQLRTKQIKEGNISALKNSIEECSIAIDGIEKDQKKLNEKSERLKQLFLNGLYSLTILEKDQVTINSEIESNLKKKRKYQALMSEALASLQAIEKQESKPFDFDEVEKSYDRKKEAVKELVKEVLIFKIDNKYTVFQIIFRENYCSFIIRQTWTKKYYWVGSDIFSFDPETLMFTNNYASLINDQTEFVVSNTVITFTPIELFNELNRQTMIEQSAENIEIEAKYNHETSDLREELKDAKSVILMPE
jgi:site-specific DNA recombinase